MSHCSHLESLCGHFVPFYVSLWSLFISLWSFLPPFFWSFCVSLLSFLFSSSSFFVSFVSFSVSRGFLLLPTTFLHLGMCARAHPWASFPEPCLCLDTSETPVPFYSQRREIQAWVHPAFVGVRWGHSGPSSWRRSTKTTREENRQDLFIGRPPSRLLQQDGALCFHQT